MTQTVLITGASSGFGKATAQLFAKEGWNVVATMRNTADGADLGALSNVLLARLDVEDPASIDPAIEAGVARFGGIDALVNNAGFSVFGLFEAVAREKIVELFAVNLFGAMEVTRRVLPHLRKQRHGTIVNVSSTAGIYALPMVSLYAASKFALEGFSEGLAYELASLNIRVKIVEPAGAKTNFAKRMGRETAASAAFTDYAPFLKGMNEVFARMASEPLTSAEEVAAAIFGAVTDGTDRLRYPVRASLTETRRTMPDEDFVALLRARYQPKI